MAYPRIKLCDRQIILVSGFTTAREAAGKTGHLVIIDKSTLEAVATANREAVAFGYVHGKWFPAA
jgi:hypothetical protein